MDYTVNERQIRYRKKMYKAGFKIMQIWVKRKESARTEKLSLAEFRRRMKKLTASGWDDYELSQLYQLLLKIIRGKKGELRARKTWR